MPLYLCVDCGGSKTSAVICDASGSILGRALGGPSNFAYLGLDAFISSVGVAVSNALKTCSTPATIDPVQLPPPESLQFAVAWFGVSGVDSPAAVAAITPVLSKLLGIPPGPRLMVANDTHLLAAPIRLHHDISHGVAVIAGTGSICVSFNEVDGELVELGRYGGWGWILGDEGGGFNVGREAVRQILHEHDTASVSQKPICSVMKDRIMEQFGITDVLEILTVIHLPDPAPSGPLRADALPHLTTAREKRLSSLSPIVFKAAFDDGDELAFRVLKSCASVLADQIRILLASSANTSPKMVKAEESVVSFGGSLAGLPPYRKMILDALAEKGHVFKYVEFVEDAAATGAVGLASSQSRARGQ